MDLSFIFKIGGYKNTGKNLLGKSIEIKLHS